MKSFDSAPYKPAFMQYEAIQFKPGIKSDLWFRFHENTFRRRDYWYSRDVKIDKFSSIKLVYRNFINLPDSKDELKKNRIARMIFRNDEEEHIHEREVISLEAFLASIAGMYKLIINMIARVFGPYLKFVSKLRWIKKFYRFENKAQKKTNSHI